MIPVASNNREKKANSFAKFKAAALHQEQATLGTYIGRSNGGRKKDRVKVYDFCRAVEKFDGLRSLERFIRTVTFTTQAEDVIVRSIKSQYRTYLKLGAHVAKIWMHVRFAGSGKISILRLEFLGENDEMPETPATVIAANEHEHLRNRASRRLNAIDPVLFPRMTDPRKRNVYRYGRSTAA